MSRHIHDVASELPHEVEEMRAMVAQEVAMAREKLAEGNAMLRDFVVREPVKALGVALGLGVVLGWWLKRR